MTHLSEDCPTLMIAAIVFELSTAKYKIGSREKGFYPLKKMMKLAVV